MSHQLPRYLKRPSKDPSIREMLKMTSSDPGEAMPERLYRDWACKLKTRYGPLIISQPDAIEQVLFDQKRFGRNTQTTSLLRRAWGKGLAAAEGDSWKQQRRAVGPAFRASAAADYSNAMVVSTRDAIQRWANLASIDVQSETGRIVSQIVLNTLIKGSVAPNYEELAADMEAFMRVITRFGLVDEMKIPTGLLDRMRGVPSSAEGKRLAIFAQGLAEKRKVVDERESDLIDLLKDSGSLVDNIKGFMSASFETTARGVSWTLYTLACLPELQEQLREESERASSLTGQKQVDALRLTRCAVKESLRMYPPAPMIARQTLEPLELLGHKLPKGLNIIIDIHALHHHEKVWDDPFRFQLERFSDSPSLRHRAAYIPFSAGPRMCVAAQFAELEIMIIVSELLKAFRFSPTGPQPDVSLHISTHSTNGLHVKIDPI